MPGGAGCFYIHLTHTVTRTAVPPMTRVLAVIAGLVLTVSVATAATGSLLQQAQVTAPTAAVSAAEEPISLNASLIAAGLLVAGFLAARRRAD